jgi:hypothetical protein
MFVVVRLRGGFRPLRGRAIANIYDFRPGFAPGPEEGGPGQAVGGQRTTTMAANGSELVRLLPLIDAFMKVPHLPRESQDAHL